MMLHSLFPTTIYPAGNFFFHLNNTDSLRHEKYQHKAADKVASGYNQRKIFRLAFQGLILSQSDDFFPGGFENLKFRQGTNWDCYFLSFMKALSVLCKNNGFSHNKFFRMSQQLQHYEVIFAGYPDIRIKVPLEVTVRKTKKTVSGPPGLNILEYAYGKLLIHLKGLQTADPYLANTHKFSNPVELALACGLDRDPESDSVLRIKRLFDPSNQLTLNELAEAHNKANAAGESMIKPEDCPLKAAILSLIKKVHNRFGLCLDCLYPNKTQIYEKF